MSQPVLVNARAAIRGRGGGVERVAGELVRRLPGIAPARYRVAAPPRALAHRAGHAWEQIALPLLARDAQLVLSPANSAPLAGARNVVFVHDLAPLVDPCWYGRAYGAWHRTMLRRTARHARTAIVPSGAVRDELVGLLGMPRERVHVAPLGVDSTFHGEVDPAPLRERLGLDRPYVLAVGSASARKNLALLDAAAPALAAAGLDVAIAGGELPYMRPGAAPRRARRLGYLPDSALAALYGGASAFALPSLYEGFGLPCLEAMACGTPVVTTRRGGLPETCGEAALYVDPGDPAAFADACVAAAREATVRDPLIAAGRERAARFTWEGTAAAVDAAIANLLSER